MPVIFLETHILNLKHNFSATYINTLLILIKFINNKNCVSFLLGKLAYCEEGDSLKISYTGTSMIGSSKSERNTSLRIWQASLEHFSTYE